MGPWYLFNSFQWTMFHFYLCIFTPQCHDLAGSWYARREHGAMGVRVSEFNGSMVQMRAQAQTRQRMRGSNGLQE